MGECNCNYNNCSVLIDWFIIIAASATLTDADQRGCERMAHGVIQFQEVGISVISEPHIMCEYYEAKSILRRDMSLDIRNEDEVAQLLCRIDGTQKKYKTGIVN
jgi:hypothetical protein